MSQPRTLTKENQLEKYLASEQNYAFFPFPCGCEPQPLETLLGFKNIKIVTDGTRIYPSGNIRNNRILVVEDQDDIIGEISIERTISIVSQYCYRDSGRTIRKKAPVESKETKPGPILSQPPLMSSSVLMSDEAKFASDNDDVIEIKAPSTDIAKEKKIATSGPYRMLDRAIEDLNSALSFFYFSNNPAYLEQSKHLIRLAAHLVEESYNPRAAEWDVLRKLLPTLRIDDNLLDYITRLEAQIQDITASGKSLLLIAIYLFSQDLAHLMQIETRDSILMSISIIQDLTKLEAWLNKVDHQQKTWSDYARGPFPLKEIYSSSYTMLTPTIPPTSTDLPTSTVSSQPTAAYSMAPAVTPSPSLASSVQSPTLFPPAVQDQPVVPLTDVVRGPYDLLHETTLELKEVLTNITRSTSKNPALQKRSDDLMKQGALLVEESYRAQDIGIEHDKKIGANDT